MKYVIFTFMAFAITGVLVIADEPKSNAREQGNPFFAFDNGVGRDTHVPLQEQADILKELGYAGIGYTGTNRIPEMLEALDALDLKLFCIFITIDVDEAKTLDTGINTAIEQLKGRDTIIWLFVTGGTPSTDLMDSRAVAIIRKICDMAQPAGLRVALYPHVGMYVARVEDAVRLVKKIDRKNVGASFNLCHFLKLDDERQLERRLQEAAPYLFLVSINGADGRATNELPWNRLIQTLDRGSFDIKRVLRTLQSLGYTGPIGLQGYNIPGRPRDNLRRSMEAWKTLSGQTVMKD